MTKRGKVVKPSRRMNPAWAQMDIVGIDASLTGTGYWILDTEQGGKVEPGKLTGIRRLVALRERMEDVLCDHPEGQAGAQLAVMEGYSYGSTSHAHAIGEWGGVLRVLLYELSFVAVAVVPPSTLKKFVIGHARAGQSGKDVMLLKTYKRWGVEHTDHDVCDAYGLARAGEVIFRGDGSEADRKTLQKAVIERL